MMTVGRTQVVFFGYKEDIAVANEVFGFLCRTVEDNARQLLKNYPRGQKRRLFDTYAEAFIDGVDSALGEGATALALVVPKEVEREFDNLMREMGVNRRRCSLIVSDDKKVLDRGYDDGRRIVHSRRVGMEAV